MNEFQKHCFEKIEFLNQIIESAEQDIKVAPPGTLRTSKDPHRVQYYWRTDAKDTRGVYIKKSDLAIAQQLAQKQYAEKLLLKVNKHKKVLQQCVTIDEMEDILNEYEKSTMERQQLICPYVLPEEQFVLQWKEQKNKGMKKLSQQEQIDLEEGTAIITEGGECVRSKSEKILADKLYINQIPYVYECPLYLAGYGQIRPDFTVLNKRTRKEYYWEHLGMMDDPEYVGKTIMKIETYQKNNIFVGDNLLLTYETLEHPLNIRIVEGIINKYLL